MDTYAELVGPEAGKEDFLRLAQHYQSVGNPLDAGRFYLKAKEYATVSLPSCGCAVQSPKIDPMVPIEIHHVHTYVYCTEYTYTA